MTLYEQLIACRSWLRWQVPGTVEERRHESAVARAVRTLSATAADALYTYATTGSAFAALVVLTGMVLASEAWADHHGLRPVGRLVAWIVD
jgi:hypothetical protein